MVNLRKAIIYLLVLPFVFLLSPSGALGQEGCIVPTVPGNVEGVEKWLQLQWDPANPDTIEPDTFVEVKVIGGALPLAWSISGNGFSLGQVEQGDRERSKLLIASPTACGPATITVTDALEDTETGYVRCTAGTWVVKMTGVCVLYGAGVKTWYQKPNRYGYELIEGHRKQTQTTMGAGGCSEPWPECPLPEHYWCPNGFCQQQNDSYCGEGEDHENCIDPDHGFPYKCGWSSGYCGCSCYCATQKAYYEYECP